MEYPLFRIFPHIKALHMSGFKDEDILPSEDYRVDFKDASALAVNYCCCRRARWGLRTMKMVMSVSVSIVGLNIRLHGAVPG